MSADNILIIEQTKAFVRQRLDGEGSGHDWWHVVRVYNNALDIAKHESGADNLVVALSALLHDVADHKFGFSDEDRRNIIQEFLSNINVAADIIEQVVYIVNNISFKRGTNQHKMTTLEGQIVQDADRLDAIGALGIARTFTFGGHFNRPMFDPEYDRDAVTSEKNISSDTISHFYEKLLLLKDRMNTEYGRQKALKRHQIMEEYLSNFYAEWNGEL